MIAFAWGLYFLYIIIVFKYISQVFYTENIKLTTFLILFVVNSWLLLVPIYITKFNFEYLMMILYCLVLIIEVRIIFKKGIEQILFGVFSFAINYFAIRVLIVTIMSLVTGNSITDLISNEKTRIFITCINFLLPIPYIWWTSIVLKQKILVIALTNKKITKLSSALLGAIFINQMTSVTTLYIVVGTAADKNLMYHLITAIFSILLFILVMFINWVYSNLKSVADSYSEKIDQLMEQNLYIKSIENESITDSMTGFYIRDIAMETLERYLVEKKECFVIFVDIDRLKYVNDTYGHIEGDFYITAVSEIVKKAFSDYIISRIGGDEFLIIGEKTENEKILLVLYELERVVYDIALQYNKPYETSISYGVQDIRRENTLTSKEIIALADNKMYIFKRNRKINR